MGFDKLGIQQKAALSRYGEPAHIILLSLVACPMHGYALTQSIFEDTGIRLGPGTLYGAITKLTKQGLIRPIAASDASNATRRRTYAITESGIETLNTYIATWSHVMDIGKARLTER